MRFRWKVLMLLVVIAMVPIVAMRAFGVHSARSMAEQLITRTRQNVVSETESRLTLLIDSYSQVLRQKRLQLEMALGLQAEEVRRVLFSEVPVTGQPLFHRDFQASDRDRLNLVGSALHRSANRPSEGQSPMISYSFQVFYDNSSRGQPMNTSDSSRLAAMTPFLTGISKRLDGLVLWHCTVLKNGVTAVFPGHGIVARFNPMQERWYTKALQRDDFWSQQFRDPFSGRNVLAFSMPVRDPGGRVIGATAFLIPTRQLLEGREILAHLPRATQSFLIGLVQNPATGKAGARILADQTLGSDGRATWTSPVESDWLVADAPGQQSGVMQDLEQGRRNIRRVRYQDCDCLWVYGPVHQDAFLLFTTPYHEILQPIDADESFIRDQIDELLGITRLGILFILAAVVVLAFAFARTVSKPMQILAEGARRLAEGHLDTRVDIRSRDEFGDMGKVFNEVGPQLEAHARFQQTMTLAREVQQHFLPGRAPVVPGLDIAGKSQYCDDVGGDYFDFIEPDDGSNRIGVVIGDVSGHGIPSALLMTTARALLRQRASLSGSIDQVIADVNLRLCRDIEESGQFMTLFYAELLPDQKAFHWLRAGHDPALLYHPDTDQFQELLGEGTTLGVSCDIRFEAYRQSLKSGQILLLTTDGIREARHPDGHMFGNASLRRIVRENAGSRADQILEAIMMELKSFRGAQAKLEDDATVVVVKVT